MNFPIERSWIRKHMFNAIVFLIMCIISTGCKPKQLDYSFPPSGATCPEEISWMNLQPGKSTKDDVIEMLGKPDKKGWTRFMDNKLITYYSYPLSDGVISEYASTRIFFRSNKVIDWIEVIIADHDGQFHTVKEFTDVLGTTVDIIYDNSDFNPFADFQIDILAGPDQAYVWSECGVAILALRNYIKVGQHAIENSIVGENAQWIVNMRYPDVMSPLARPVADLDRVVLMEFLFPPSTFEIFLERYLHRIPHTLWYDYLDAIIK